MHMHVQSWSCNDCVHNKHIKVLYLVRLTSCIVPFYASYNVHTSFSIQPTLLGPSGRLMYT